MSIEKITKAVGEKDIIDKLNEVIEDATDAPTMSITAGTETDLVSSVIPLPNGYTRAQCHYVVWPTATTIASSSATLTCTVDQGTGMVAYGGNYAENDSTATGGKVTSVGWLCIARS